MFIGQTKQEQKPNKCVREDIYVLFGMKLQFVKTSTNDTGMC